MFLIENGRNCKDSIGSRSLNSLAGTIPFSTLEACPGALSLCCLVTLPESSSREVVRREFGGENDKNCQGNTRFLSTEVQILASN